MATTYDLDVDESGLVDGLDTAIKALSEVVAKLKETDKAAEESGKSAKKAGVDWKAAAGMATTAAAGLVATITSAAVAYKEVADRIAAASKEIGYFETRTGLSKDTLAGLQLAAKATGQELEDLVPEDLATRIVEAAEGGGEGARVFELLGVKVRDSAGNVRDADSIFRDYTDALAHASDQTIAAGLADDMFSDAGTKLLAVLRDGSATLDMYSAAAQEFGTNTGPEAMKASAAWAGATNALSIAFDDATRQIVGPTMQAAADFVNSFALGFVFIKDVVVNTFKTIDDHIVNVGKLITGQITLSEYFTDAVELYGDAYDDAHDRAFKFFTFTRTQLEETERISRDTSVKITIEDEKQTKAREDAAKRLSKTREKEEKESAAKISKIREIAFDQRLEEIADETAELEKLGEATISRMEKETKSFEKELEKRKEAVGDLILAIGDSVETVSSAIQQSLQESLGNIREHKDAVKESLKELRQANKDGATAETTIKEQALVADMAIIKAKERETIKGIRAAFFADKAAALSSIAINTAVAIMQAFAQTGIGGTIAAAGITIAGGVQAGVVASEKPPVHSGNLGADEGIVLGRLMRQGEELRVMSQRSSERMDAMERGRNTNERAAAELVLADAGRVIGAAWLRETKRPGSRIYAAGSDGAVNPYRRGG